MAANPRRIGEIKMELTLQNANYTDKEKKILEAAAMTCPVFQSLHPDLKKTVSFHWL